MRMVQTVNGVQSEEWEWECGSECEGGCEGGSEASEGEERVGVRRLRSPDFTYQVGLSQQYGTGPDGADCNA